MCIETFLFCFSLFPFSEQEEICPAAAGRKQLVVITGEEAEQSESGWAITELLLLLSNRLCWPHSGQPEQLALLAPLFGGALGGDEHSLTADHSLCSTFSFVELGDPFSHASTVD